MCCTLLLYRLSFYQSAVLAKQYHTRVRCQHLAVDVHFFNGYVLSWHLWNVNRQDVCVNPWLLSDSVHCRVKINQFYIRLSFSLPQDNLFKPNMVNRSWLSAISKMKGEAHVSTLGRDLYLMSNLVHNYLNHFKLTFPLSFLFFFSVMSFVSLHYMYIIFLFL